MKILCFSDTHGDLTFLKSALAMHPDADAVFFLGDGLDDVYPFVRDDKRRPWYCVRGNCDRFSFSFDREIPTVDTVTLGGKRITYTHGHVYGAKSGNEGLIALGRETGADIVLFGHTHTPTESFVETPEGSLYLFNPGAASYSYHKTPHFGVIMISESGVLLSHGAFA